MMTSRCLLSLTLLIALVGCGEKYKLIGHVVSGPRSSVQVVDQDDPRLAGPPVSDAAIQVVIDPESAGRQLQPLTFSNTHGEFEVPLDSFGAGFLEYEMLVMVRAQKKTPAEMTLPVPPADKRVLVIMADGRDQPTRDIDPLGNYRDDINRHFPR